MMIKGFLKKKSKILDFVTLALDDFFLASMNSLGLDLEFFLKHMRFNDNVTRNNNCNYDGTEDKPEDKVEPSIFVGEHI